MPQVIRDYNEEKGYLLDDLIYYHYHYLRAPLPFYNITSTNKEPIVLYISAGNVEEFHGDVNNKVYFQLLNLYLFFISVNSFQKFRSNSLHGFPKSTRLMYSCRKRVMNLTIIWTKLKDVKRPIFWLFMIQCKISDTEEFLIEERPWDKLERTSLKCLVAVKWLELIWNCTKDFVSRNEFPLY